MEEYFSADRLLQLNIGSLVQINREGEERRFTVRLVGLVEGRSVITSLPIPQDLPNGQSYEAFFESGSLFEMKTIHEGRVIAFETNIIRLVDDYLLIGNFPEMIETRRLRRDVRFPCALSCDIQIEGEEAYGVICDISSGGCQLNVNKDANFEFISEALISEIEVVLEVFFPFYEKSIPLKAKIKSSACMTESACKVGVAFTQDYECVRLYLESLQLDSISSFFN